jgi:hypothetical protein
MRRADVIFSDAFASATLIGEMSSSKWPMRGQKNRTRQIRDGKEWERTGVGLRTPPSESTTSLSCLDTCLLAFSTHTVIRDD